MKFQTFGNLLMPDAAAADNIGVSMHLPPRQDGGLVDLKDSKLAGVFGYVQQQMFDFDPEW